jgi:SOS-response transcriptional repressor LexA
MTPIQQKTLKFIEAFWEEHDYSPSYREISHHTQKVLSNVYRVVDNLVQRGFLVTEKGRQRAIYPVDVHEGLTPGISETTKRYRDALVEIRKIAECSEGVVDQRAVEFYAMLADRALKGEG